MPPCGAPHKRGEGRERPRRRDYKGHFAYVRLRAPSKSNGRTGGMNMRPNTDRQPRRTSQSISGAFLVVMLVSIALLTLNFDASAQAPAQPASPKLYIFDLGSLKSGNPKPLLDRGVTVTDMSVVAYLVVHPRGTLLWDAGTIPDELVKPGGTTVARATVHKTLSGQLAEIGYKPSDISYLALSHYHYDHSANANQFAGSTWLVQGPERAAMFPDSPPANPIDPGVAAKFSALKNSKTTILN